MSHLVREIECMIANYIKIKYDDDTLRSLTGMSLEMEFNNDEDSIDDFGHRLLRMVLEEIDWNRIVKREQDNLPELDEEENGEEDD